mmetsp:Transcript_19606/g.57201  ORF Transcript_19606/g.57201 Transcript_19606/m.57201 type:complete len:563 (-) Transcript_19606:267-1955(-)
MQIKIAEQQQQQQLALLCAREDSRRTGSLSALSLRRRDMQSGIAHGSGADPGPRDGEPLRGASNRVLAERPQPRSTTAEVESEKLREELKTVRQSMAAAKKEIQALSDDKTQLQQQLLEASKRGDAALDTDTMDPSLQGSLQDLEAELLALEHDRQALTEAGSWPGVASAENVGPQPGPSEAATTGASDSDMSGSGTARLCALDQDARERGDATAHQDSAFSSVLARIEELEYLLQRLDSRSHIDSAPELVEHRLQTEAIRLQLSSSSPGTSSSYWSKQTRAANLDSVMEHARVRRQELLQGQERVEAVVRRSQTNADSGLEPLSRSPFFSFDEDGSSVSPPTGSPYSSASASSPAWEHKSRKGLGDEYSSKGGGSEDDEENDARRRFQDASRQASRRQATLHEWISREFDLLASAGVCQAFLERSFRERATLARQLHDQSGGGGSEEEVKQAMQEKTRDIADLQDELADLQLAEATDDSRWKVVQTLEDARYLLGWLLQYGVNKVIETHMTSLNNLPAHELDQVLEVPIGDGIASGGSRSRSVEDALLSEKSRSSASVAKR